jgi:hypothetical protein
MSISRPALRRLAPLVLPLLVAAPAAAGVIVVDDDGGPGVDYTDLPPAVAAAAVDDLILVHPGDYSAFTLDKGLRILGSAAGVHVATGSVVTGVLPKEIAVLAQLEVVDLELRDCAGTVVLEQVRNRLPNKTPRPSFLTVDNCHDVRLRGSTFEGSTFTSSSYGGEYAVGVDGSRIEVVQSSLRGNPGVGTDCGSGGSGGIGLSTWNGAWVHVAASDVEGGEGGYSSYACPSFCNQGAGRGGNGIDLGGASTLLLAGHDTNFVRGGFEGNGGACDCDGDPGTGLRVHASTALYSGAQLFGGGSWCSGPGQALSVTGGGSATQVVPPDPLLELQGSTPAPGAVIRFAISGQPGDKVVLYLGRKPMTVPIPGVLVEQLTTQDRAFQLGAIPAGQYNKTLQFKIPAYLWQGFPFFAQAAVIRGGQELRTNSVPIVLR